ncbi:GntR family transcriptional regulator [Synergistaceae bacterium OttesenSCG-928-D05]|nr:GntR family transcriptional regulator [Synergistaceae bacterium OttesenSCG-928-D05]
MINRSRFFNTSADFVYVELRNKIINKQIRPGERLPEVKIATEMDVSRTPVREALRRLASEGLVRIIPNSGARVSAPTVAEMQGAYLVREHLESLSVVLACKNGLDRRTLERIEEVIVAEEYAFTARDLEASLEANNAFHRLISEASKNPVLIEYIDNIMLRTNVYVLFYDTFSEETNYSTTEHKEILRAIATRDVDQAEDIMRKHLKHSHSMLTLPEEIIYTKKGRA